MSCQHLTAHGMSSCAYVQQTDACDLGSLIPYLTFTECDLSSDILADILLFFWTLLLISALGTTAEVFFVPSLNYLSVKLRLSPAVAGITLLALGNGAPDIFTAMAAVNADDFALTVSALIGASMCISSLVLGSVILVQAAKTPSEEELLTDADTLAIDTLPPCPVNKTEFKRDLFAYMFAVAVILVIVVDGAIYLWEAIGLLVMYVGYVAVVVYLSKRNQPKSYVDPSYPARQSSSLGHHLLAGGEYDTEVSQPGQLEGDAAVDGVFLDTDMLAGLSIDQLKQLNTDKEWFLVLQILAELPLSFLRYLSIPSTDNQWSVVRRWYAIASPLGLTYILLVTVYGLDLFTTVELHILCICFGLGLLCSLVVFLLTSSQKRPVGLAASLLALLAFVGAIAWLNLIATETVATLTAIGVIWDIDTSILGLTVLAMGNSVGDFVADISVARQSHQGYATAVATCFGSPLLNDVVGLGLSLTFTTARLSPEPFRFDGAGQIVYVYLFLLVALVCSLIAFPTATKPYQPSKGFGWFLISLYVIFILTSLAVEVWF